MTELARVDLAKAYRLINHGPVVMISTTDGQVANACTVAWCAPASRTPARIALTLGRGHKTYENLVATKECVLNVPTEGAIREVMVCGKRTGHDGDKLGPAGIEVVPSSRVGAPRLACCAAWLECELVAPPEAEGPSIVVVEVVLAETLPGVIDSDGHFDVVRFPTLHHLGGSRPQQSPHRRVDFRHQPRPGRSIAGRTEGDVPGTGHHGDSLHIVEQEHPWCCLGDGRKDRTRDQHRGDQGFPQTPPEFPYSGHTDRPPA